MFKNRKLTRISLLVLGLLLVLGSAMYVVPRVLAATCFSDVNGTDWFEPYVCWLKTKGITSGYSDGTFRPYNAISRAEMAVMLRAAFTNTTMVDFLTTGPSAWVANDASPAAFVQTYYGWSHLHNNALGNALFQISPTITTSLYNTSMYAKGVKICYLVEPGAYITEIAIKHMWYTSSGFTEWNSASDTVDKTTTGCSTLYFSVPSTLFATDQITVLLYVTYTNTSVPLFIGTTSVIVYPSTSVAVLGELGELGIEEFRGEVAPAEFDPASGLP